MTDRFIAFVGWALLVLGAVGAVASALHGVSNVAALVSAAAGTAFITISYDDPEGTNPNE
ncbi:hypothetical protein CWT12_12430 [Actinomyces sp. 432]|uniref:hypothetical protein n=1 Tax=Actinomyces sp. 432 TaxID=2057798 RepID=UPI00137451A9|nr:hypothetical protein [Actinomyces sp. 432]QHO91957.1 hypothetical protein CWT12_12430 [Actinomyces sp. 432]